MKRKTYFHFAAGRVLAGMVIGAIVFGVSTTLLEDAYDASIIDGFNNFEDTFEKLAGKYDDGTIDETFIDIYTNYCHTDFFRFAKVNDDGTFETILEKEYEDVIPISDNAHSWIYVTDREDLLAKGSSSVTVNGNDWTIRYLRCDELKNLDYEYDILMTNSWSQTSYSDDYTRAGIIFRELVDSVGMMDCSLPAINSYYIEGDTLHIGRMTEMSGYAVEKAGGRKWDFTDYAKEDLYITENDGFAVEIYVYPRAGRPDAFLNDNADIFLAANTEELFKLDNSADGRVVRASDERHEYSATMIENGIYTQGAVNVFELNGTTYMIEYVMTSVRYTEYFRTVIIIFAIFLLILCIGIPCIAAIKPYSDYKKAYENNIFKNNLIDSLAHNIKTPLQIIGGYAENLKDVTGADKDHYADRILAKTSEMNSDIEAILNTADKSDRTFSKTPIRPCLEEVAKKAGADIDISGDASIKMDKDYFKTALFCLVDNAARYKTEGTKIEASVSPKCITIKNKTSAGKFTPGFGIAIAGRIIEQHGLKLTTGLKDGVFEAKISKK